MVASAWSANGGVGLNSTPNNRHSLFQTNDTLFPSLLLQATSNAVLLIGESFFIFLLSVVAFMSYLVRYFVGERRFSNFKVFFCILVNFRNRMLFYV